MKSSVSSFILIVILLLSMFLQGCSGAELQAGEVLAVQNGTALWIIKEAIAGKPDTLIMSYNGMTMYIKAIADGWGFVVVDMAKANPIKTFADMGIGGNFTNPKSMGDLVTFLKGYGWEIIPTSALAQSLLVSMMKAAEMAGNTWPTFFVAPFGAFDGMQEMLKDYVPQGTT